MLNNKYKILKMYNIIVLIQTMIKTLVLSTLKWISFSMSWGFTVKDD